MTEQTTESLPEIARLQPRQQMAMDCARCARPLGAGGRIWGETRHRGHLFRLWVCAPHCPPRAPGGTPP
ncbi:hypothetical protein [Streptomyces triticirhizae]|uniref:hypothetical protein n=1 Tax=Streptomyces triticirhizae TaxID=2483353 RepID=UPI0011C41ACC|nr:hypothetical protein [Streptomyces triticirhizae]